MPRCCRMLLPRFDRYTLRLGISAPLSVAKAFCGILQAVAGADCDFAVSSVEITCVAGASGSGCGEEDDTGGVAVAVWEAERWAEGETEESVGAVVGAPCLAANKAPVSMLNSWSSCWRSCSALLSSRCPLRSSACHSRSSCASSRERRRSSADCCQFRKLTRALPRLPWPLTRSHEVLPPRRRFLCLTELDAWKPSLLGCSDISCVTGSPWGAAVVDPAVFKSLKPGNIKKKNKNSYFLII